MSTPIRISAAVTAAFWFSVTVPTLASTPTVSSAAAVARSAAMGTSDPFIFRGGSFRYGWVAGCLERSRGASGTATFEVRLWTTDQGEESIDRFLTQSKSGRYAAFVKSGRIIILDSVSRRRIDLTDFGATYPAVGRAPGAIPLEFTYGHWVLFVRVVEQTFEVVGVNLETAEARVLFTSGAPLYRIWADPEGKELFVAKVESDEAGAHGADSESPCLEAASSLHERRVSIDVPPPRLHRVQLASLDDQLVREEQLTQGYGCIADGRRVVVKSFFGGLLVAAASPPEPSAPLRGPVRWVRTEAEPSDGDCVGANPPRHGGNIVYRPPRRNGGLFLDFSGGYRYSGFERLNRSISERGYTHFADSQITASVGWVVLVRRYWVGLNLSMTARQYSQLRQPQDAKLELYGPGAGLFLGYEAFSSDRVTLTPSCGFRWLSTQIDYPAEQPPFDVPDFRYEASPGLRKSSYLVGVAARFDIRVLGYPDASQNRKSLHLGASVGYDLQVAQSSWRFFDGPTGRFDVSGPSVDRSGPAVHVYLNFGYEIMDR